MAKKDVKTSIEKESDNTIENAPVEKNDSDSIDSTEASKKKVETKQKAKETDTEKIETAAQKANSRSEVLQNARQRETEREERKQERNDKLVGWEQLISAARQKTILRAPVTSVAVLENIGRAAVVVFKNGYRIIIPCSEVYRNYPLDESTIKNNEDRLRREQQVLTKLLGADIPFVITAIKKEGDEPVVVGSRKAAVIRSSAYYYDKASTGETRVNVGDIVDADVVTVGLHGLFVNAQGFDTRIPLYQATNRYTQDLSELFAPGDSIRVKVKKITHDDNGKCVSIDVSAKEPELDSLKKNLKRVSPGARCLARITSINERKDKARPVFHLFLEDLEIPAIATNIRADTMARPPRTGDVVVFAVYEVVEDGGFCTGSIIKKCASNN